MIRIGILFVILHFISCNNENNKRELNESSNIIDSLDFFKNKGYSHFKNFSLFKMKGYGQMEYESYPFVSIKNNDSTKISPIIVSFDNKDDRVFFSFEKSLDNKIFTKSRYKEYKNPDIRIRYNFYTIDTIESFVFIKKRDSCYYLEKYILETDISDTIEWKSWSFNYNREDKVDSNFLLNVNYAYFKSIANIKKNVDLYKVYYYIFYPNGYMNSYKKHSFYNGGIWEQKECYQLKKEKFFWLRFNPFVGYIECDTTHK